MATNNATTYGTRGTGSFTLQASLLADLMANVDQESVARITSHAQIVSVEELLTSLATGRGNSQPPAAKSLTNLPCGG